MSRHLWINPSAGVAGDMLLGGLLGAGADEAFVRDCCGALGLDGWTLDVRRVRRAGLTATQALVTVEGGGDHHHHGHGHGHGHHEHEHGHEHGRPHHEIRRIITEAGLPERVREPALAAFAALAEAEALVHDTDPDTVVLHEAGAVDAMIDIVGASAALVSLEVDRVTCAPVAVGHGSVMAAHGRLPNPAPAVQHLLLGVPVRGVDTPRELTTPTGAALLRGWPVTFGACPAMTVTAQGRGAGTADPPEGPNVVSVWLGEATTSIDRSDTDDVAVVEATVDDVTGEQLAGVPTRLVEAGALDAWIIPGLGRKGRPVQVVSALCAPAAAEAMAATLMAATGSLGARWSIRPRLVAPRRTITVEVDGHSVGVKVGPGRAKAEREDVERVARLTERPEVQVATMAEAAAYRTLDAGAEGP